MIANNSAKSIEAFVKANVKRGTTLITDGHASYPGLAGYRHDPRIVGKMAGHIVLPWIHRAFSLMKRWSLGTYHGLPRKHVDTYLNELLFVRRVRAMGIRDRPTSPRSPWQNGYAERLVGSIRQECIDHVIVFGERHLPASAAVIPRLLQRDAHTSILEQGCADLARDRGSWSHSRPPDPWWIASPIRADLICDRDRIRDRPISPRSPWQNPYAERLIGTLRRDCLDHVLIFGARHLRQVPILSGLHHCYARI